jgi:hypothetical protein
MRKTICSIILFLILVGVFAPALDLKEAKARYPVEEYDGIECLQMTIYEDVTMFDNCTAKLSITFDLPERARAHFGVKSCL